MDALKLLQVLKTRNTQSNEQRCKPLSATRRNDLTCKGSNPSIKEDPYADYIDSSFTLTQGPKRDRERKMELFQEHLNVVKRRQSRTVENDDNNKFVNVLPRFDDHRRDSLAGDGHPQYPHLSIIVPTNNTGSPTRNIPALKEDRVITLPPRKEGNPSSPHSLTVRSQKEDGITHQILRSPRAPPRRMSLESQSDIKDPNVEGNPPNHQTTGALRLDGSNIIEFLNKTKRPSRPPTAKHPVVNLPLVGMLENPLSGASTPQHNQFLTPHGPSASYNVSQQSTENSGSFMSDNSSMASHVQPTPLVIPSHRHRVSVPSANVTPSSSRGRSAKSPRRPIHTLNLLLPSTHHEAEGGAPSVHVTSLAQPERKMSTPSALDSPRLQVEAPTPFADEPLSLPVEVPIGDVQRVPNLHSHSVPVASISTPTSRPPKGSPTSRRGSLFSVPQLSTLPPRPPPPPTNSNPITSTSYKRRQSSASASVLAQRDTSDDNAGDYSSPPPPSSAGRRQTNARPSLSVDPLNTSARPRTADRRKSVSNSAGSRKSSSARGSLAPASTRSKRAKANWNEMKHQVMSPTHDYGVLTPRSASLLPQQDEDEDIGGNKYSLPTALSTWLSSTLGEHVDLTTTAAVKLRKYHALVVSVDTFDSTQFPRAPQTNIDMQNMTTVLRKLGYCVHSLTNPTCIMLLETLASFRNALLGKSGSQCEQMIVWIASRGYEGVNTHIDSSRRGRYMVCKDTDFNNPITLFPLNLVSHFIPKAYIAMDMWDASGMMRKSGYTLQYGFGAVTGTKCSGSELFTQYPYTGPNHKSQGLLTGYLLKALAGKDGRMTVNSVNSYLALKFMQNRMKVVTTAHPLQPPGNVLCAQDMISTVHKSYAAQHTAKRNTPKTFQLIAYVPVQFLRNMVMCTTMLHQFFKKLLQRHKRDRIPLVMDCVLPLPGIHVIYEEHKFSLRASHEPDDLCAEVSPNIKTVVRGAVQGVDIVTTQDHQTALSLRVMDALVKKEWDHCVAVQKVHISFSGCARDAARLDTYLRIGKLHPYCSLESLTVGPDPYRLLVEYVKRIQHAWFRYYTKNRTLLLLRSQRQHEQERDGKIEFFLQWRQHQLEKYKLEQLGLFEHQEDEYREVILEDMEVRYMRIVKMFTLAYGELVTSGKAAIIRSVQKTPGQRLSISEDHPDDVFGSPRHAAYNQVFVGGREEVEREERIVRIEMLEDFRRKRILLYEDRSVECIEDMLHVRRTETLSRYHIMLTEYQERLQFMNYVRGEIVLKPYVLVRPVPPIQEDKV
eukprot:PhF_6_TR27203/c0_g1_i1/m.39995